MLTRVFGKLRRVEVAALGLAEGGGAGGSGGDFVQEWSDWLSARELLPKGPR